MPPWRIKAYYLAGGTCPIKKWYTGQIPEVRAEFDAALDVLRSTVDWTDTQLFKILGKTHAGLGEIRFKLENVKIVHGQKKKIVRRFRPVGIWPPSVEREFVLLAGCEKLPHGILIPSDAFTLALDYKRRLEEGEGEIYDFT